MSKSLQNTPEQQLRYSATVSWPSPNRKAVTKLKRRCAACCSTVVDRSMAKSYLQREVNLSRRACRTSDDQHNFYSTNDNNAQQPQPTTELTNGAKQQTPERSEECSSTRSPNVLAIVTGSDPRQDEKIKLGAVVVIGSFSNLIAQFFLLVKALVVMMMMSMGLGTGFGESNDLRELPLGRRKWHRKSSRSSDSSFSLNLLKWCTCVVLISVLLAADGGFVLARPNTEKGAAASGGEEPVVAASAHVVEGSQNTPQPGMQSSSQLKRSAEIPSIILSTVPSEGGGGSNVGGHSSSMVKQDEGAHGEESEEGGGGHEEGHKLERYPVAQVEFSRVETPFVIGVWILSASIAKIGGCENRYTENDDDGSHENLPIRGPEPKILETYSKLTMRDAMDYMRRNPSTIGQMSGTESMSALFRNYTGVFGGRCGASFLGTCPSFSNLENSTRNLDMQELDYNPSKKDLTDAKIHHLLSVELKPYRRQASTHMHENNNKNRRLSYSRHAVDDRDLSTQVNYKMQMNIRRMISEKKHHKRSKRVKDGKQQNHVSFPEFAQNGSAKQFANGTNDIVMTNDIITITNHHPPISPQENPLQPENPPTSSINRKKSKRKYSQSLSKYRRLEIDYINEVLHEDNEDEERMAPGPGEDWDGGGLTFTAKATPDSPAIIRLKPDASETGPSSGGNDQSQQAGNAKNNSLIAQITSLPGFDPTKARIVKHVSSKLTPTSSNTNIQNSNSSSLINNNNNNFNNNSNNSISNSNNINQNGSCEMVSGGFTPSSGSRSLAERPERLLPTAAESFLPWRREKSYQSFVDEGGEASSEAPDKRFSKESRDSEVETRVTTPTAIEAVLPWKRVDEDDENGAIKQNEFPSWASNKEYLAYNSPSATFLGGLTQPKQAKSVIGLFRRESSGSGGIVIGGVTDSETSSPVTATTPIGRGKAKDKRSASIAGYISFDGSPVTLVGGDQTLIPATDPLGVSRTPSVPYANAFPVTASHRRNNRRGSMLELSGYSTANNVDFTIVSHRRLSMKCCEAIPEENYTKSLPERDKHGGAGGARRGPGANLIKVSVTPGKSHHQLLGRHSNNPAATALLSSSSTDSEEEEEEDDEAGHMVPSSVRRQINNEEDDDDEEDDDEDCADEQHPI
ncbi:uncharacterized protein LOC129742307 [Uranotaenia lowii]|uniref:uncharacterized protein LOC129742307 n=1 Tax=Uranotaenia lowii TaxID=190385 RepID=UPI002479DE4C|nr:uncharacterized protein LOC129742307 [Uranotaenia lowii]